MIKLENRSFYVYALKDPRRETTGVFYVGKGQGLRKTDHLLQLDDSPKSRRIGEIRGDGHEVILEDLVTSLTENEALKIEAELISAFGTLATGGVLLNQVIPVPKTRRTPGSHFSITPGLLEKASIARALLEDAILAFVLANPYGVRNVHVARCLELQSAHGGKQRDYLTYSILGNLLAEGRVRQENGRYLPP